MSVTFWYEGDPEIVEEVECVCVGHLGADSACSICDGKGLTPYPRRAHEQNFSNDTARALLAAAGAAGLGGDLASGQLLGKIPREKLERLARGLLAVANSEGRRRAHVVPGEVDGDRYYDMGVDDDRLREAAARLLTVVKLATEAGEDLFYS